MKKLVLLLSTVMLFTAAAFSQTNNTVDISDDVYEILKMAEVQGLCGTLSNYRPYTEKYIVSKLDQILESLDEIEAQEASDSKFKEFWRLRQPGMEREVIEACKARYIREDGLSLRNMAYRLTGEKSSFPVTFDFSLSTDGFFSGGAYADSSTNAFGYEVWETIDFFGDLGKYISYRAQGYLELTKMNLTKLGEYPVAYWWYDEYAEGQDYTDGAVRTVNTYRNYAVLPYSYKKHWDGSVYYLRGGINAGGLTGWPFQAALGFGMQGELHGSFFSDLLDVGIGRMSREWAAMDYGSSLVMNAMAHPFFGIEASVKPFDWVSFSTLTGFLEFPNQNYINGDAWYITDNNGQKKKGVKDSYFFHNLFAMAMLDLDFKYVHWDFGSTVIFPNRFELGYSFPLVDRVVYQNNVGDYDNLALYTDLKLQYPGVGYIWGSLYLDEMNAFFVNVFQNTRCMFAYQGGTKLNVPWLPFATFSFRYTKVEPYCYTHQALSPNSSQPYYPHYLSESYTNNGESLGYYLPPNADEFFFRLEFNPLSAATFGLQYQLVRHGVDWGTQSYMDSGSSIYSELTTGDRDALHKYFLHDGTYEWMNIFAVSASYDFKRFGVPVQLYGTIGYVHNWFTSIGSATPSATAPYSAFSNEEYAENRGLVISVGLKAFVF